MVRRARPLLQLVFPSLILLQTALALGWAADNFGVAPTYGDTSDYIERAKIMAFHRMRPFTLPALLRLCREFNVTYSPHLLFLLQTALAWGAVWRLSAILAPERAARDRWPTFLAVAGNPLFVHFNFTILPDSLAMSCSLLAAAALWKATAPDRPLGNRWLVLFAIAFALAANARGERLVSLSLGFLAGALVLICARLTPIPRRRWLARFMVALLLGLALHLALGKAFPKSDLTFNHNYNFTVYQEAACFVTWTRAERLRPYWPPEIQAALSLEECRAWDKEANYAYVVHERLAPLGEKAYKAMIVAVLRHDLGDLAHRLAASVVHYTLSPVYPYFYPLGLRPAEHPPVWSGFTRFFGFQNWTFTRMAERSPRLTAIYWLTASFLTLLAFAWSLALLAARIYRTQKISPPPAAWIFLACACLATALVFVANPVLVHVRYALTWSVFALTALFSFVWSAPAPNFIFPRGGLAIERKRRESLNFTR